MSTDTTNRYANAKVYKITDNAYTEMYIGSTTHPTLAKRMAKHRENYKRYKAEKYHNVTSFMPFDKYGVENCKIDLIENYPCKSKEELNRKEGEHIKANACVNKVVAGRTRSEYHADNIEIIRTYGKAFRESHMAQLSELNRLYREANEAKIKMWKSEKISCENCGAPTTKGHYSEHKTSKKCRNFSKHVE